MDRLLKVWFVVSLWLLIAAGGWYVARAGLHWSTVLVCIGVPAIIILPSFSRNSAGTMSEWMGPSLMKSGLSLSTFLIGIATAQTNILHINDWMDGSMVYLESMINPVHFSADSPEELVEIPVTDAQKKSIEGYFSELHIYDHRIDSKILVSFSPGPIVILDGKTIIPLVEKKFLLAVEPDNSLMFVNRHPPYFLTKAIIRNDKLYMMWERLIPDMNLHHWGDVFESKFYSPGRAFVNLPNDLSQQIGGKYGQCSTENAEYEVIHIFDDATGEYLKSVEILPLIAALGKKGDAMLDRFVNCKDPLHLNSIHVVKDEKHAEYFPHGKVGDILISLRSLDTIALLDRDTFEIKWYVTGQFKQQHEPTITDRGTVLVFDNWGGDAANGASRLVEIGIRSRKTVGTYEATGSDFFQSDTAGKVTLLTDHQILVQEQNPPKKETPHDATMFILDCPGRYISNACEKEVIFRGEPSRYSYENAAILQEQSP